MSLPGRFRPSIQSIFFNFTSTCRPDKLRSAFTVIQARYESTLPNQSSSPSSNAAEPLLSSFLVTPQALTNALRKNAYTKISTAPRIIPLCAAWFMPNDPEHRTGQQSFLAGHVPQARFFDIDGISDKDSPYPHMLPSPETFSKAMSRLGIHRDDSIVVYDSAELGIFSAPRVAWTLKVFGHQGVHILNSFKLWVDQGFPIEKGEPEEKIEPSDYPVSVLDKDKVMTFEELREHIQEQGKEGAEEIAILDARSPGRFQGTDDEPRPGLSSGHMPKAINIPFADVLNARTKAFLPSQELRVYFECQNVDPKKPIVSSCGTGVTACVIDAALTEAGYPEAGRKVYDGSWTEWAMRADEKDGLIVKDEPSDS